MLTYARVYQRQFLSEYWHKAFGAALAIWLPAFLFSDWLFSEHPVAAVISASIISLILLLVILTSYEGFELQPSLVRYRKYTWVAGLRFGNWHQLPEIYKVTLRPITRRHFLPMGGPLNNFGFTAKESKWQVLLNRTDSPIGVIAAVTKHSTAQQSAKELSDLLQVPLEEQ